MARPSPFRVSERSPSLCARMVDKNGGDSSTMKFTEVPFPRLVTPSQRACRRRWLNEPFFTIATKKGQVKLLNTRRCDAAGVSCNGMVCNRRLGKAHPDLVARFARAMNQAGVWLMQSDKVVPILVDKLKADPAMLAIGHRTTFTDKLVNGQIQPLIDIVARYQKVRRSQLPTSSSGMNSELLIDERRSPPRVALGRCNEL